MFEFFTNTVFLKYFVLFIVFFSVSTFSILNIKHKNKNSIIDMEANTFLFVLIFFIAFLFKTVLVESNDHNSAKFLTIIGFILILQYGINYTIEYNSKYLGKDFAVDDAKNIKNYFKKLGIILFGTLLNIIFGLLMLGFAFNNNDPCDLLKSFTYAVYDDYSYYIFFFIILLLFHYSFNIFYTNTAKSSLILPSYLGISCIILLIGFVIYIGRKLKIINWRHTLSTVIALLLILSLFFYVWLYMFMDSINNICKNKIKTSSVNKNDDSFIYKYLVPLLFISIFIMLWLVDSQKWSKVECFLYIFITLLIFTSFTKISVDNPNTSLLTTWLTIEWFITTFYNFNNVKNSIQCLFSQDR